MATFWQSLTIPAPADKPRFRGVSHKFGAIVAFLATALLIALNAGSAPRKALAVLVFGGSMTLLLAVSATYHCVNWKPAPRAILRRLDHSAIFLLIAGGWTPLLLLVPSTVLPDGESARLSGYAPLVGIWAFAAVGVVKSLLWPKAPRWIMAGMCVAMGWMVAGEAVRRVSVVGLPMLVLIIIAGVTYSLGAVVYALKKPNPAPTVFGYHEVFHALVLIASAFLYAHVLGLLAIVPA